MPRQPLDYFVWGMINALEKEGMKVPVLVKLTLTQPLDKKNQEMAEFAFNYIKRHWKEEG